MPAEMKSRLMVLGAALLFSTGGTAIKATSFSAWQVAGFRAGIACAVILLMIPGARSGWSRHTVLVGCIYAMMTTGFVLANKLTTAANAIFLQGTAPIYLLLGGPLVLGERIRCRDVAYLVVMITGMALFFLAGQRASVTAPDPVLGNLVGAINGLIWAVVIGGLRWLERTATGGAPGLATVAIGCALASLGCMAAALPVESARWQDWATVVYLGAIQIGLAYVLLTSAMRGITALETALLLLLEPALSPIWAWLIHGETPAPLAVAGGVVLLAATAGQTLARQR
jgi:drug/metabolite transporter (DMT)-like permease